MRKSEPKVEREAGARVKARIDDNGVNSRTECKVSNPCRTAVDIVSNIGRNRSAKMVAESKRGKVGDREAGRLDGTTDEASFESSIVRAGRNVIEGGDEFGGIIVGSVFEEQVGKEIVAAGLEIRGGVDSRGGRHKKGNGVRGATERKASKSRRQRR